MRFAGVTVLLLVANGPTASAFVSLGGYVAGVGGRSNLAFRSHSMLMSLPEPLASEGDWTAYLDEETTGLVYYFNSDTGESVWEPPTNTFPKVKLGADKKKYVVDKRKEYQESRGDRYELQEGNSGGGFFGSLFGGSNADSTALVKEPVAEENVVQTSTEKSQQAEGKSSFFDTILQNLEDGQARTASRAKDEASRDATDGPPAAENELEAVLVNKSPVFSFGNAFGGAKPSPGAVAEELVTEEGLSVEDEDMPEEMVQEALAIEKSFVFPDVLSVFKAKPKEPEVIVPSENAVTVESASLVLPSPEKISWGGEDACFAKGRTFGVFDGVSGADKLDGIPLYSETLSRQMRKTVPETGLTIEEITTALTEAAEFADVSATGASTAVVASVGEDGYLRALNLGDCVVMVLRDSQVVARTKEISHYFDCPYQLGEDSPDRPIDGTTLKVEVLPGDIIVAGSDGIFDNLRDDDIWPLVEGSQAMASIIAKAIIDESRTVSLDVDAPTPYAKLAKKNNYDGYKSGLGGKVDDISCVVVRCT